MQKYKKCKVFFYGVLLGIFLIEGGMRFAIWHSIKEIVPDGVKYEMSVTLPGLSGNGICLDTDTNDFMTVFYTKWLISMFFSNITCRYKSSYINLFVNEYETETSKVGMGSYHWSFYHAGFVEHQLYGTWSSPR